MPIHTQTSQQRQSCHAGDGMWSFDDAGEQADGVADEPQVEERSAMALRSVVRKNIFAIESKAVKKI